MGAQVILVVESIEHMDGSGVTNRQAYTHFPGQPDMGRYLLEPDLSELDLVALAVECLDRGTG